MTKGIDVYNGTGVIDYAKVKSAGYDFVMIKSSEGYTLRDRSLSRNLTDAAAAGLSTGVYHWLHARNVAEAKREADFFLDCVKGVKLEYPVALDIEQAELRQLGKAKLTDVARAWLDTVRAAGWYAMVYANLDWVRNCLDMERLKGYDLWLAQYNSKITYDGPVAIWQYSDSGRVPGIKDGKGNVDMNESYKDFPSIIRGGGWNNFPKQTGGIKLDTKEKKLFVGEVYDFLAKSAVKPEVKADPWGIVHTEYVRDEGERGYKFRITGLKPGKTQVITSLEDLSAGFPAEVVGIALDTREKSLKIGEVYDFLAKCSKKPEVKADPWGIVHTEYVRDEGERGFKFRITGLKTGKTQVMVTLDDLSAGFPAEVV